MSNTTEVRWYDQVHQMSGHYQGSEYVLPCDRVIEGLADAGARLATKVDDVEQRLRTQSEAYESTSALVTRQSERLAAAELRLDNFRTQVREVAIRVAEDMAWCDQGLNEVLDELGLPLKEVEYRVQVAVTLEPVYVTVTVTAADEDAANDAATDDWSGLLDQVSSEIRYGGGLPCISDVEVERVEVA